jgi:hypothetical protein
LLIDKLILINMKKSFISGCFALIIFLLASACNSNKGSQKISDTVTASSGGRDTLQSDTALDGGGSSIGAGNRSGGSSSGGTRSDTSLDGNSGGIGAGNKSGGGKGTRSDTTRR